MKKYSLIHSYNTASGVMYVPIKVAPKQIATVQQKIINYVWNFRRNNRKSLQKEWKKTHDNINFTNI